MELSSIYSLFFEHRYWIIPAIVVLVLVFLPNFKGWLGEFFVKSSTRKGLPKTEYHSFHNVTFPTLDGTTQIDHVFVSEFGVFVVETKNMTGWIFGNERQAKWTQIIYEDRFQFQNPLRQNYKHVKALESALSLPYKVFHSVVVFVGDSEFKTTMPENVLYWGELIPHIKSFRIRVLSAQQVSDAVMQIESGRLEPTRKTRRQHVKHLKSRSNRNSKQSCPRCGRVMILRTAKKGANVGHQFWGCSTFPQCRAVINID